MGNREAKKQKKLFILLAIAVLAIIVVIVVLAVNKTKDTKKNDDSSKGENGAEQVTLMSVGDEKFTLADMMYYIYGEEELGCSMESFSQSSFGESYWDTQDPDNNNLTGRELAKENILDSVQHDSVYYQEALKAGYTLTDEDKQDAEADYKEFCENLTSEQLDLAGMKDKVKEHFQRQILISKYKDGLLQDSEYKEEDTIAAISKEEYRQYDYEYYFLSKYDADGEKLLPEEELSDYLTKLRKLQAGLTKDSDMEALLDDKTANYIEYVDSESIVEGDGEAYGEYNGVDCDKAIKALENGQISDVIDVEFGYMVVRMIDNNVQDAYNEQCENAVQEAEDSIYETMYSSVVGDYVIKVEDAWNKVVIGNITLQAEGMVESTIGEVEDTDEEE